MAITVVVRCSTSLKFSVEVDPETTTVAAFKTQIAEQAEVPAESQRLIYKGRVMKDDQTLSSYGECSANPLLLPPLHPGSKLHCRSREISFPLPRADVAAEQTIHLVKGGRPAAAAAAAQSGAGAGVPVPPQAAVPGAGMGMGAGAAGGGAFNPFAAMGGMGGMPDVNRMQQQLASNPEMMADIMNSPMMQSMLNNPEFLRNMMTSNPQMRQVMENNPQLAHVLNDPNVLRQTVEMMRNPNAMREAMRSQDLAMSHIENHPEGFNALRRMYRDVQEPMMQATANMANERNSGGSSQQSQAGPPQAGGGPMPNPWATNSGAAGGGSSSSAPAGAGVGAGAGAPAVNPWAMPGGGAGGAAGGMGFPGGAPPDMSNMMQMMNDPLVSQMMGSFLSNPSNVEQLISSNPMLQQMVASNPGMRDQIPNLLRSMSNPETMRAVMNMQESMQTLQRAGLIPPGMEGGFPGMPPMGVGAGGFGAPPPPSVGGLDFSSLLGGAPAMAPPGNPAAEANPEETYASQLTQLNAMGFSDRSANIRALVASRGNVNMAVERLIGGL